MSRADLQPTSANSARFLLELANDAGASATYRAQITTADATYEGTATLTDDGSAQVAIEGAGDVLVAKLQMFGKLVARAAGKRREDGMPPWPPRITRWRPVAEGGDE